jgi:N-acetylneuraminate synthase
MSAFRIGSRLVGDDQPCFIIAEIGINHNGDIDLAKRLISVAVAAGCDAVKFQKRTVEVVYSAEELAKPARTPSAQPMATSSSAWSSARKSTRKSMPSAGPSR